MKAGRPGGAVLDHSTDRSLGEVFKLVPEWNLRDTAYSGPEPLLAMFERRAGTSLLEQYCDSSVTGRPGDATVILDMMDRRKLRHAGSFEDSYSLFVDDEDYGLSCKIRGPDREEVFPGFEEAEKGGGLVPRGTGELVMARQFYLLESLNAIVEIILEQGSRGDEK